MNQLVFYYFSLLGLQFLSCQNPGQEVIHVDVLVLGGGTGGTCAGIAASRLNAKTLVLEPTAWLGGMLTAAGVSAIDGNHHMPAGLWGEFRQALRNHYGGAEQLATGWVSHTLFEPHVGVRILDQMCSHEEFLEVRRNAQWDLGSISYEESFWKVTFQSDGVNHNVQAKILIDGTDLGDVAASVGCDFDYGMDGRASSGEPMAPAQENSIIQDFTYTAILKDYGSEAGDHLLQQPPGYNPIEFDCACADYCTDTTGLTVHPCGTMLTYAKLPNEKYLINWPLRGNDYYADLVSLSPSARTAVYAEAKQKTLRFVYFIQQELGYGHLGLADDEFPTADALPLMPYHREGRRVHGLSHLTIQEILEPYHNDLFRDGIAVGDYPIDHHHAENPEAPQIAFPPVPSFSIPLGALIPRDHPDIIMADKAISVSNIANGSSRLQPVVMQIGTAAGILAALAIRQKVSVANVSVRDVQGSVLNMGGYLVPSYDLDREQSSFKAFQRMAALGLLRGQGEPYQWANRTWFYPDSTMAENVLRERLKVFYPDLEQTGSSRPTTTTAFLHIMEELGLDIRPGTLIGEFESDTMRRVDIAVNIDKFLDPFHL